MNKPTGNRGCAYVRVSDGEKQDPQRQRDTINCAPSDKVGRLKG
jgi:hypothetical protein